MSISAILEIIWIAEFIAALAVAAVGVIMSCFRQDSKTMSGDKTLDKKNCEQYIAEGLIPDKQSFDTYKTAYLGNGNEWIGKHNKEKHRSFYNYLIWFRDVYPAEKAAAEERRKKGLSKEQIIDNKIKSMTTDELRRYILERRVKELMSGGRR
jgi:hypothetical protein